MKPPSARQKPEVKADIRVLVSLARRFADMLSISTKTVETHQASAMRKLGLNMTAALIRYAVRNKVVAD